MHVEQKVPCGRAIMHITSLLALKICIEAGATPGGL